MTISTEFTLPVHGFPLGRALEELPDIRIELEQVVPSENGFIPFFWVWNNESPAQFEASLDSVDELSSLALLDTVEDGALYRVSWANPTDGFIHGVSATGAVILGAIGTETGWTVDLRFTTHTQLREFQTYCADHKVSIELKYLHTKPEAQLADQYRLTETQFETLLEAYKRGYYTDPKTITQRDLAEHFGVSQRAISKRLQRGYAQLIKHTIAGEPQPT
ncbi:helix-turn-helix domain-containing protein [Halegenticoccus soli]|uniref:helix-turn-helix domain-containing protein n=1 Tax=Halegenticoccus soli TaxID=1985678 RepID=UPI000C6DC627|nr:helix-turn-helix domain-containing protein [Halegenticoccus soli]